MKFNDGLFEDVSRVASGAASVLTGLRDQFEQRRPGASDAAVISREEFDAVREMAAKAREIQDDLLRRIAALEARLVPQEDVEKQ